MIAPEYGNSGRSESVQAKIPLSVVKKTSATLSWGGHFFTSGSDTVSDGTAPPGVCSCGREATHPGEGGMSPLTSRPGLMSDNGNRIFPVAKPALSGGPCSHHVLLLYVAKGPHVVLNEDANSHHVATLDGAFSPHAKDVSQRAKAHLRQLQKGW